METERTVLTAPTDIDRNDIFLLKSNEQTRKHLGGPVHKKNLEEKFQVIRTSRKPEQHWIVKEKLSDEFIGLASITKYHDGIHYEISYEFLPNFWGKGYGTEIMKRIIDYGFQEVKFMELYAETQEKNAASIRLLQKVGMEHIDTIQRFGEEQVVYALCNPL